MCELVYLFECMCCVCVCVFESMCACVCACLNVCENVFTCLCECACVLLVTFYLFVGVRFFEILLKPLGLYEVENCLDHFRSSSS